MDSFENERSEPEEDDSYFTPLPRTTLNNIELSFHEEPDTQQAMH